MTNVEPGYEKLNEILSEALKQASIGKGKERHATEGEPFHEQQICEITRRLNGNPAAGALFQAVKKIYESGRVSPEAGVHELLGAINYISAAIIVLREQVGKVVK